MSVLQLLFCLFLCRRVLVSALAAVVLLVPSQHGAMQLLFCMEERRYDANVTTCVKKMETCGLTWGSPQVKAILGERVSIRTYVSIGYT